MSEFPLAQSVGPQVSATLDMASNFSICSQFLNFFETILKIICFQPQEKISFPSIFQFSVEKKFRKKKIISRLQFLFFQIFKRWRKVRVANLLSVYCITYNRCHRIYDAIPVFDAEFPYYSSCYVI